MNLGMGGPAGSNKAAAKRQPDSAQPQEAIRTVGPMLTEEEGEHMRTKLVVIVTALGLLLAAVPALAHHAFAAEFDQNKPIKVQGSVVKWELTNPHSWIHIDVKGADGKTVTWMIEGASPNNLYRLGLTKESLPPGSVISVEGYQAKDGSTRAVGRNIVFANGKKFFLGLSEAESGPAKP